MPFADMTRFRYCRDAFFLAACAAYGINRCLIKPHAVPGFMMFHFNDLWLIPCVLPPVLWLHERLGLRTPGAPPQMREIVAHLVFWSVLFEWLLPRLIPGCTGDPADVAAYSTGALLAGLWWRHHYAHQAPASDAPHDHSA